MRTLMLFVAFTAFVAAASGQDARTKVYETERSFETMAAEKGINAAFIEFMSPVGIVFMPDAVNGREAWRSRPASPASLTWNPVWIDVASNGVLAYSIGNSRYRAQGKDDPQIYFGHYLSIWVRQPNGEYRAALDTGISHEKPASEPTDWKSPADSGKETNPGKISAGDSAVGFYEMASGAGHRKAYRSYLADDAVLLREGKLPAFGRKPALELLDAKGTINFAKRKSFTEAADLAYVNGPFTITDDAGKQIERGNFVQVWKLRGKRWLIVADVLVPIPNK